MLPQSLLLTQGEQDSNHKRLSTLDLAVGINLLLCKGNIGIQQGTKKNSADLCGFQAYVDFHNSTKYYARSRELLLRCTFLGHRVMGGAGPLQIEGVGGCRPAG
jgi:hypothetical protein